MAAEAWSDAEDVVLAFFMSRKVCFSACAKIMALKCSGQRKLIKEENPQLFTSDEWNYKAVDAWLSGRHLGPGIARGLSDWWDLDFNYALQGSLDEPPRRSVSAPAGPAVKDEPLLDVSSDEVPFAPISPNATIPDLSSETCQPPPALGEILLLVQKLQAEYVQIALAYRANSNIDFKT